MTPRMNFLHAAPDVVRSMIDVNASIHKSGLDTRLAELVKLRVSQINGCAFCIHTHVLDAIKAGEADMRLHLLDGWRHSPLFSDRERAALNWAESLTRVIATQAPDADYDLLRTHFSEKEAAYLTALVATMNFWNRVQIAFRVIHPEEAGAVVASA